MNPDDPVETLRQSAAKAAGRLRHTVQIDQTALNASRQSGRYDDLSLAVSDCLSHLQSIQQRLEAEKEPRNDR